MSDGQARLGVTTRPEDHNQAFPSLRQPTIVGEFSLDSRRGFHLDRFHSFNRVTKFCNCLLAHFSKQDLSNEKQVNVSDQWTVGH